MNRPGIGRCCDGGPLLTGHQYLWIAAHAEAGGMILVTNNEREFLRVPGLKVQNWVG